MESRKKIRRGIAMAFDIELREVKEEWIDEYIELIKAS